MRHYSSELFAWNLTRNRLSSGAAIARGDPLELIIQMQHYGLPTRILDWTKSALVALFFACLGNTDKPGRIFAINPDDLNHIVGVTRSNRQADINDRMFYKDAQSENSCMEQAHNKPESQMPMAIAVPRSNPRIIAQCGEFTLHGGKVGVSGAEPTPILAIPGLTVHIFEVNSTAKSGILKMLQTSFGISEEEMFPDDISKIQYRY